MTNFLSNLTARISGFVNRLSDNEDSTNLSRAANANQTNGANLWQRYVFNFDSSAATNTVSANDRALLNVAQRVAAQNPQNDAPPTPKAVIIPLKPGVKQAGYEELARRTVEATLHQNGINPTKAEIEMMMELPSLKNLDMNGWIDKKLKYHNPPGLMIEAGLHKDAAGNQVFGYKQTLTPQFQQGVIADYKQVRGELAKPENVGRKAVVEMNLRERFAAAVKIAYDKGYISTEIKQQLGSLTAEEIAAAVAFGGALGIAATSAEASAVIGPVGTFAGAVYGGTQLTQLTKVLLLSAKATNREQLEPAAKAFGAWMGSLSKDGVLAIAGAAGGAAVSPTATAAVDAVLTKGVSGAKRAMSGAQAALEQETLITNEGIIIRMPKQKTAIEKMQEPLEMRAKVGENGRRNVKLHEQSEMNPNGGHTMERHTGKSESWLRNRLKTDSTLEEGFASSFNNVEVANRVQGRFVNRYKTEINAWLKNSSRKPLKLELDMKEPIGIVVENGKAGHTLSTSARAILIKDNSEQGWHFLTSFPIK